MNKNIVLININKLKSHEKTIQGHMTELRRQILEDGFLRKPILVDKASFVILDGQHRFTTLKMLGAKRIPAILVQCRSRNVRVYLRRKYLSMPLLKESVINRATDGIIFPPKSTRFLISGGRPSMKAVSLSELL